MQRPHLCPQSAQKSTKGGSSRCLGNAKINTKFFSLGLPVIPNITEDAELKVKRGAFMILIEWWLWLDYPSRGKYLPPYMSRG